MMDLGRLAEYIYNYRAGLVEYDSAITRRIISEGTYYAVHGKVRYGARAEICWLESHVANAKPQEPKEFNPINQDETVQRRPASRPRILPNRVEMLERWYKLRDPRPDPGEYRSFNP